MVAQSQPEESSYGLTKLAGIALDDVGGDWDKAILVLRAMVLDDRPTYERLIEPMIDDGLWSAIRSAAQKQRQAFRRAAHEPPAPLPLRPEQAHPAPPKAKKADYGTLGIVAMVERTLHNYPLPGGKRLGDATPADILGAANYYRRMETTNRHEARWFELIHEAMHDGSCVEKTIPHAVLERLRRQADEE